MYIRYMDGLFTNKSTIDVSEIGTTKTRPLYLSGEKKDSKIKM